MEVGSLRAWLAEVESSLEQGADAGDVLPALALVAGQEVTLDEQELRGTRRRALLLLAAGGDPHRELALESRAVGALASDLDEPSRRAELMAGMSALREQASGLEHVERALAGVAADPELAWRLLACALLAEELAED